jgi:hypothetical protein
LSSATARVGDTIEFTTAYPERINGLVFMPKGTAVSGTVAEVTPPRRASRDSRVNVAIEQILLPTGEYVTLRPQKSARKELDRHGKEIGHHPSMWTDRSAQYTHAPTIMVTAFTEKGREWVYKAGAWTTVYFNGPLTLDRGALANLEPPPYKGPAQVFIKDRKGKTFELFMNQADLGEVSAPVRLELKPGTYSFSIGSVKGRAAVLGIQEDHQYWVEREAGGLFVKDPAPHRDEIEELEVAPWVTDKVFLQWVPAYKRPGSF